jgi:P pilus assembly chaperone PapD
MSQFFSRSCSAVLLGTLLATSGVSQAALKISPVRPVVESSAKSTFLTLENTGDAEQIFDVRVRSWRSQDSQGVDTLEETNSVMTSLPVVKIPAKEAYTIRLIVKQRSNNAQDNYRVILRDITPPKQNNSKTSKVTLAIKEMTIPMFVMNDKTSKGALELRDGVLSNVGGRTVKVTEWQNKSGETKQGLFYVLPGTSVDLGVNALDTVKSSDDMY